jgi:6-phosphogluconolactonase
MRIKSRWSAILALFLSLSFILTSCSSSSTSSSASGTGFLWLAAQGNATVQAYTINLSNGALSLNGSAVATGNTPTSIVVTPKGDAVFILNSGTGSSPAAGGVSAYTVGSDGTLKTAGSAVPTGPTPAGMAISAAGTFLLVANQGTFDLTQPGSISVFAVSGATLTAVTGSPFLTEAPGATVGTGPVSAAVSASGNYLYVANQFANTVTSFQISSSGALTQLNTYPVGISPSAVFVSIAQGTTVPAGQYLYVANTGSNNISAFSICDVANASSCSTPNGVLTPLTGSPFPAQPGPVAITMDPTAAFLYVADEQANQISKYSWSSGTGALTPLSPAMISAGGNPVSLAIRSGVAATTTVAGVDYLYVANLNGSSVSVYTLNTTTGILDVLGSPITTPAQPSAIAVR